MVMQNERGLLSPGQGEMGENTPFACKVGKKSVNTAGPQQDHNLLSQDPVQDPLAVKLLDSQLYICKPTVFDTNHSH